MALKKAGGLYCLFRCFEDYLILDYLHNLVDHYSHCRVFEVTFLVGADALFAVN